MEATSKQNHILSNETTNFTLLTNHLLSKLSYFLWLCSITFATSVEALLLLQNYELIFHFLFLCFILLSILVKQFLSKPSPIYLIDFSCLKPPSYCKVPFSTFIKNASLFECFDNESMTFMEKVLRSSGQSEETYLPPSLHCTPPKTHNIESIKEAHMVLFPIMDDLFAKTNILPFDIDILILNCSGFCPSPSLTSIVVSKYCMRNDIKSYNVSGMGCGASAICVDLAHNLLRVHKNTNAIVLSTEILSNGWYPGNERSKLNLNCMFRMGGAAILFSNKKEASKTAKYKLVRSLRTQRIFDDKAYFSCIREEDSDGKLGVTVNKDVPEVIGETLVSNISILGSQILPLSEKFWYVVSVIKERFIKSEGIYVPDFKTVIQHFILPCSARGVILGLGKRLKLGEREIEAALMTLHRFGNQSSSSLWYELAYLEAKEKMHKGDNIWLLGIGSGFKCCSVILKCNRPKLGESNKGPWSDCIHQYPISTSN